MNESLGLGSLFLSSFLAATLLPGGSEIVFAGLLASKTVGLWPALGVATLGNTLGGLSSYVIGRVVPQKHLPERALAWVRKWGPAVLLLSWVPVIGDPLCLVAGWLRLNPVLSTLFMAAGKFARYWVLAKFVS
ncbi:MAG TPA: YqaA family protein [Burkholderiales bacterium]|nr:YqaA family protein [Burkholderiales bacterium]